MGLLCSKCVLKSFAPRKETNSIEIHNNVAATEKATNFGKFARRKVAKKRPVISTPRPANPVHLHGRKWKHVIVTIPAIDDPPVAPLRKKRRLKKAAMEKTAAIMDAHGPPSISDITSVIPLRRYLRVLHLGFDDNLRTAGIRDDLFYAFLRHRDEEAGRGNETIIIVACGIDYAKNTSLINESNDIVSETAPAFDGYRFKNFPRTSATDAATQPPAKRDLDKWKRRRSSDVAAPHLEIRAFHERAQNEKFPGTDDAHSYVVLVAATTTPPPTNINRVVSITPSPPYSALNVKNIFNKANQKPNNMYRLANANIEKVSNQMEKTLDENVLPSSARYVDATATSSQRTCPVREQRRLGTRTVAGERADSDPDSDTSITESLAEFTCSLGT